MSNLKKIRESLGYSQATLSFLSDVSYRAIQAYESGYRDINKAQGVTLRALADALGCRIEDIMDN